MHLITIISLARTVVAMRTQTTKTTTTTTTTTATTLPYPVQVVMVLVVMGHLLPKSRNQQRRCRPEKANRPMRSKWFPSSVIGMV
uniref:Putative secreted protein n=1 Tax=Anopheles darlingi TaxID=43151 RepID=A0A2M4D745_ANODA